MIENKNKLRNEIEDLQLNISSMFAVLEKIAIYQKKVVMMAEILNVAKMHMETNKTEDKIFVKIDLKEREKGIDSIKFSEISSDEKIYREWIQKG